MKLRIRGDSVRLRLRKPQVLELLETGSIAESTAFGPDAVFHYRIEIGGEEIVAYFQKCQLRIVIPRPRVEQWASTDQTSIEAEQVVGNGRMLRILIEKDFACRSADTDESQDGAFENPVRSNC